MVGVISILSENILLHSEEYDYEGKDENKNMLIMS
jgi:hypothetical protein